MNGGGNGGSASPVRNNDISPSNKLKKPFNFSKNGSKTPPGPFLQLHGDIDFSSTFAKHKKSPFKNSGNKNKEIEESFFNDNSQNSMQGAGTMH